MKLNAKSWHARVYKVLANSWLPDNLCDYVRWWMIALFWMSLLLSSVSYVGYKAYQYPFGALVMTGFVIGLFLAWLIIFWILSSVSHSDVSHIARTYLQAKKERWCPRIEWMGKND